MANKKQKVVLKFKDDAFLEQFISIIMRTGKIKIVGIGIFEIVSVKERKGYSIETGGDIKFPPYKKLRFRPTVSLKELIQTYGKAD